MMQFLKERDARQAFFAGECPADPNRIQGAEEQPQRKGEVLSGDGAHAQSKSLFSLCNGDTLTLNSLGKPRN